ncbi:dienelactone hydrolase family protein [Cryptosporangium sp. NPDC051539]|uniref:dienelactone hydrolase family protein n=1 Tax=Cryptosporangium sp. NPDC051539 TaxID=3363962 RepID=UPI0037901C9D
MSYLARPATASGVGVLIGFEMFGITGYVRRVADRVAALGHLAIVPDYYHGITLPATAEGREQGFALLRTIDRPAIEAGTAGAIEELRRRGATRIAGLGLSVGGHFLYYAATRLEIETLIAVYPGWLTGGPFPFAGPEPTVSLPLRASRTVILTGADDHLVDVTALPESAEVVVYPGTPHGYLCDERDTYRPEPAKDTWARVAGEFAGMSSAVHTCERS